MVNFIIWWLLQPSDFILTNLNREVCMTNMQQQQLGSISVSAYMQRKPRWPVAGTSDYILTFSQPSGKQRRMVKVLSPGV
jgi:hypothetical protein